MSARVSTEVQVETQLKIEQELLDFLEARTDSTAAPAKHTWARKASAVRKRRDTLASQLSRFKMHWMIYDQPRPIEEATCTDDPMEMIAQKGLGKIIYVVDSARCACCQRKAHEEVSS